MIDWLYGWAARQLGPRERKFRWFLITIFKVLLIPLSLGAVIALGTLAFSIFAFFNPDQTRGNAVFVIAAETDRLSFEISESPQKTKFFIDGATIAFENTSVVDADAPADSQERFCLSGWIEALPGSTVDLMVIEGRQAARITEGTTVLSNGSRRFALNDTDDAESTTPANALMAAPSNTPDGATPVVIEALSMQGTVQIRDDADCPSSLRSDDEEVAFAPRNEPIFIDGPGQIGQQTDVIQSKECSGNASDCEEAVSRRIMEPGRTYITGDIDILAREKLCWDQIRGRDCNGLFRLDADSVPLPTGASVQGVLADELEEPTPLFGQVHFDGAFYVVNVWSNANWIALTFPIQTIERSPDPSSESAAEGIDTFEIATELSYNELRLSFLDQILTDAWLLVAATALLTLLSWVLSVLQIELDMVPQQLGNKPKENVEPVTTASPAQSPDSTAPPDQNS
ncbi:hypothetical protein [uncultured Roseobacter sp.]|uniref:hypothetical protein n=1 Tax=uncultured Roseobacter sp. TaxID=114847 RepID=UPI002635C58C|nr:hypothetical protein [uncultured Roseobacter sp.]